MLVWCSCGAALFSELKKIYVRAAKLIYGLDWLTSSDEVLLQTEWKSLKQCTSDGYFVLCSNASPEMLRSIYVTCGQNTRADTIYEERTAWCSQNRIRTSIRQTVQFVGASLWNSLDNDARFEESLAGFRSSVQELGF